MGEARPAAPDTQRTLLGGLFDYAGMFPPASLPFEEALRNAAGFERSLSRPWLVGAEAVLPEERLADLTPELLVASGFTVGQQVRVAVLGHLVAGTEAGPTRGTLPAAGRDRVGPACVPAARVSLVSYEVKVRALGSETVAALESQMRSAGEEGMRLYLELEWSPAQWLDGIEQAAETLAALHDRRGAGLGIGLKVRGSGPTAIDRPALAAVIAAVNARNLPFKATAGLHHPIVEAERYGNSLGFLNLAAALRLQKILGPERFPAAQVEDCLGEADPAAFRFDGSLSWRGAVAGERHLAEAVRAVPFSIGSCSLQEPDEDLSRLFAG